ncbi:sulfurtransferase [Variovorax dokdonensis]|uniref:Sulfurtransferase n=1 Tax=Variovorax dokdonensis TaxID=344883 RepID=A0ABT7NBZ4_9BURK|nr:sulfurtransferase [Variovorax dokdonensis]MDM0045467.1 sulfurtransferase [Variovorax dokdonensis]
MAYDTLISVEQLRDLQSRPDSATALMVFDCSFDLMKPDAGEHAYREAHIPGAVYAHLDTALSAKHGAPGKDGNVITQREADAPASGGRHPLPSRERFAAWLSSVGFSNSMQAVVYDRNGCNYCGRLWWMLRWMGHEAVAVLDGGLQAWTAAGYEVTSREEPAHFQSNYVIGEPLARLVGTSEVVAALESPAQTMIDARAAARYRGEVEPLDPVAGHIPGALNRPFADNLGPDGKFKPAAQLRSEFESLLGDRDPATVVHQCGSGVSAVPNLLAMRIAGFAPTALYAGSWSEWSNTPGTPKRQGAEP